MFFKIFRKSTDTEEDMIARYRQSSDLNVLWKLYSPLIDMVYSIAYKHLYDEEKCKDVVMEVFGKLIDDLKKHEISNFRSWLHSVTRNYCLQILRKNKEENIEITDAYIADYQSIENFELSEIDLKSARISTLMQKLNIEQRTCLEMFFWQEKSYKEIVEITGFNEKNVKSYIQNGKRNLKIMLERNEK